MRTFIVSCLFFTTLCLYPAWAWQYGCISIADLSGNITDSYSGPKDSNYEKCWNILNLENRLMEIKLKDLDFEKRACNYVYLTITASRTGEKVKWCADSNSTKPLYVYSNVTVKFYVAYGEMTPNSRKNFELRYKIDDGITGIEGVREAYRQAVNWLSSNSSASTSMKNVPKAVTALAVAEGAKFDGKDLKEELLLKKRDLRISIDLLRDTISIELLSTYINSILSTCHSPRNFYGYNLVELLKNQMAQENFAHPVSYLALCNANETWPDRAYEDLSRTYKSISRMPFISDYQAFAVMALSCKLRRGGRDSIPNGRNLLDLYDTNLQEFRRLQNPTGSFGNILRTALISQALESSIAINEYTADWNQEKAMKFLIKSMKVTDFLSTYTILPLLNGKTLVDIAFKNCSAFKDRNNIVDEVHEYLGPKIQVQYSLFVGDTKDVIHTIGVKVPEYFTVFDLMKFAALKDKKYEFKYEWVLDKLDIYEMLDTPNDPEEGKFWLLYWKDASPGSTFVKVSDTMGPSKTTFFEGYHIAMWYKRSRVIE